MTFSKARLAAIQLMIDGDEETVRPEQLWINDTRVLQPAGSNPKIVELTDKDKLVIEGLQERQKVWSCRLIRPQSKSDPQTDDLVKMGNRWQIILDGSTRMDVKCHAIRASKTSGMAWDILLTS
jgi:hypothetical protein